MSQTKAVRNAINRTFSAQGGVFWSIFIKVLEDYLSQPLENQNQKKAALALGRNGREGEEV